MLYREAGDFKVSYPADQQTFPIKSDRLLFWVMLNLVRAKQHGSFETRQKLFFKNKVWGHASGRKQP